MQLFVQQYSYVPTYLSSCAIIALASEGTEPEGGSAAWTLFQRRKSGTESGPNQNAAELKFR